MNGLPKRYKSQNSGRLSTQTDNARQDNLGLSESGRQFEDNYCTFLTLDFGQICKAVESVCQKYSLDTSGEAPKRGNTAMRWKESSSLRADHTASFQLPSWS